MEGEETALIVRGVLSLGRRLRAERPQGGTSLSAIAILAALRRLGPVPAVRLAAEERLQPQSLTRLLTRLENDGLITRMQNETDRRKILISLTPRGLEALSTDIRARRQWLERATSATLTDNECETLIAAARVMRKLSDYGNSIDDSDESAAVRRA